MRFYKFPKWHKWIYPGAIWDFFLDPEKTIYLTFDDGPHPVTTPFIIDLLAQYNAKATFFCSGNSVKTYPEHFQNIVEAGHSIGNHGMEHISGLHTPRNAYIEDVHAAADLIDSKLFRPPYGRLSKKQFSALKDQGHQTIFWSVLSYDFDTTLASKKRLLKMKKLCKSGSIVVFHENEKAKNNLMNELPLLMKHWHDLQFKFSKIEQEQ